MNSQMTCHSLSLLSFDDHLDLCVVALFDSAAALVDSTPKYSNLIQTTPSMFLRKVGSLRCRSLPSLVDVEAALRRACSLEQGCMRVPDHYQLGGVGSQRGSCFPSNSCIYEID